MEYTLTQAFFEGRDIKAYNIFGAHVQKDGVRFAVYAPNAQRISVVGSFNDWDETADPMVRDEKGIWECTVKSAKVGDSYKYRVVQKYGNVVDKIDPYAFYSEMRPKTNSVIADLSYDGWTDKKWMNSRSKNFDKPVNIYEMHVGSWTKEGEEFCQYKDIEADLIAHCKKHNFTHVEVMPLCEHPFDGSWGYQCTAYFASTARCGTNQDLMHFVNALHEAGIGIIMDFVPVHFVKDDYALRYFDGTPLYEYDKEEDANSEWGTLNFNLWREEVRCFLMSAANFWLDKYHFDGLRMDAISNAIFWKGNKTRGVNEGACNFMKRMNHMLNEEHKGKIMLIAEDSSDFQGVTHLGLDGGLGFDYKWDLGWMNDTFKYFKMDPIYRQYHHNLINWSMAYFYSEKFILPFSHDEVVHGKATVVDKMWGTYEQKFAQARALYAYMFLHPGKKLNFMGNELGMLREWDEQRSCDWFLRDYPMHDSFEKYFADLGKLYVENDAFYGRDYDWDSFQWIDADDKQHNTYSFIRKGTKKDFIVILNFSTNQYHLQFGVPTAGLYREVLNSQWGQYNGDWVGGIPRIAHSIKFKRNNQPYMIEVEVPAFGDIVYEVEKR